MTAPLSQQFWSGRRVFVTGHTGFKGGWLTALLKRLGAEVSGYALAPPSQPNLFEAAAIADLGASTIGDIRDDGRLNAAMAAAKPDIVLHLAAQALVRPARAEPVETFSVNVVGTAQVLEAVRQAPSVTACVVVTSDKVYDNVEWPWAYRKRTGSAARSPTGPARPARRLSSRPTAIPISQGQGSPRDRAGRQRHRWRGLGRGPAHPRCHALILREAAAGRAQSFGRTAVAARARAAVRAICGSLRRSLALRRRLRPWPSTSDPAPRMPCRCG